MAELIEAVTEHDNTPTGEILTRAQIIEQKAYCRGTNVFIVNSKGEILCHQRSFNKERFPGAWITHLGGHVASGETYESNVAKELHEECGVDIDPAKIIPWRTTRHDGGRLWLRDFVVLHDAPTSDFTPQPGEVEQFAWFSINEILEQEKADATKWKTGTHDLRSEYEAMRAALVVAHNLGAHFIPDEMHAWSPSFYVIPQAEAKA
ncbi:MAG: NUDIX domain-containing protein [Patescibacteria group bacterium]